MKKFVAFSTLAATLLACSLTSSVHASPDFFLQNFQYFNESSRLPAITNLPGTDALDVDFADVDSDGDLDLYVANGTASVEGRLNRLYINNGRGRFTDQTATRLPNVPPANSTEVEFADVDGDGDLDAIIANLGPEQLLLNNGNGVFADASANLPRPIGFDISAEARFADVDGDGDQDILVANENPFTPMVGAQNRLWINNGFGVFTDETALRLPARLDQSQGFAVGDIDRDGDLDAIVVNQGQDFVLINNGAGVFYDETTTRFPETTDATRKGVLAHINRDNCLDLVMANSRGQQDRLYLNNCQGVFRDVTAQRLPVRDDTSTDVDVIDMDWDGDLDFYISNSGPFQGGHGFLGEQNFYLRNNGNGRFSDRTLFHFPAVVDPTTNAEFGDVDRDGDKDLIVSNASTAGGSLTLYIRKFCLFGRNFCW